MDNDGTIYCISNIKNKRKYIGQTTKPIELRFKEHMQNAFDKNKNSFNTKFSLAIRKLGEDSFDIKALKENIPNNELNNEEKYYIKYYNSYRAGYNATPGGDCEFRTHHSDKPNLNKHPTKKTKNMPFYKNDPISKKEVINSKNEIIKEKNLSEKKSEFEENVNEIDNGNNLLNTSQIISIFLILITTIIIILLIILS